MKMRAGLALNGRKPRQAAARIAVIRQCAALLPESSIVRHSEIELMAETPQASPSSPSMKLTALVSPTIQKTVIGIAQLPNAIYLPPMPMKSIVTPCETANSATTICTASLRKALSR